MTDILPPPAAAEVPPAPTRDEKFVRYLLGLRATNQSARSALRRGDSPALADRALPYLAAWNLRRDGNRDELAAGLLFAAAICRYDQIGQAPGVTLGQAAYRSIGTDTRDPIDTNAGRRVVAAQRQTLKVAHRSFAGPFAVLHDQHGTVDWVNVWNTYRRWDVADTAQQREVRRSVLLGFFGTAPTGD